MSDNDIVSQEETIEVGGIKISLTCANPLSDDAIGMGLIAKMIFQTLQSYGYRDLTYESAHFPSRHFRAATLHAELDVIPAIDADKREPDRRQRFLGRPIKIEELPNQDEFGVPKTRLTLRAGVIDIDGDHWNRQPQEE